MAHASLSDTVQSIARCRVIFSVIALVALCTDPMSVVWRDGMAGSVEPAAVDPRAFIVMGAHLGYSLTIYYLFVRRAVIPAWLVGVTMWNDALFAAAIALCTHGASSPFYAFFVFAVLVAAFQSGMRRTLLVTAMAVVVYLGMIGLSPAGNTAVYVTRPAYLAIIGYLAGYLGQRRLELEARLTEVATGEERARIARDLHDGCVQTMAAVNLRLATCQDLLRQGRHAEAFTDLAVLRSSVTGEYDNLRAYMRGLAGVETRAGYRSWATDPQWSVRADFTGSGALVYQVLQILREGVLNVRRHADAASAAIRVHMDGPEVLINIDDDGVGLRRNAQLPWSLSSRVTELGGVIKVARNDGPGAHLTIELPQEQS
jgi:signal transduction histidine kinase